MSGGEKARRARELFTQGHNCAQSVFASFCEETGMDFETALRLSSSFGGGMGRLREVCGALTAVFAVAGLRFGCSDPGDGAGKAAHYALIQGLAERFKAEHGSIICRELLALPPGPDSPAPAPRTAEYYEARPCGDFVAFAAAMLEDLLSGSGEKSP